MEVTSIATALSGLKTALEIAKDLKGIYHQLGQAELKLRLIDLIDALTEAKLSVSDTNLS